MADRFFMRFNLQNSVAHYPSTAEVFAALFSEDEAETREILADFEAIQAARVGTIKEKLGDELSCLHGKKVLFLGDSITSDNLGYRVTVTRAAGLRAVDGSISGGTSSAILHATMSKLKKEPPDLVSLMVGGNDSTGVEREGLQQVSPEEYERNLRAMLGWIGESGAKLLLFEISPVEENRFARHFGAKGKLQSEGNIGKYNQILRRLAKERGVEVIPHAWIQTETDRENMLEQDGIHFSLLGQETFSEYWLRAAIRLYK